MTSTNLWLSFQPVLDRCHVIITDSCVISSMSATYIGGGIAVVAMADVDMNPVKKGPTSLIYIARTTTDHVNARSVRLRLKRPLK